MGDFLFVYLFSVVMWAIIWGVVTNRVIQNKGYYENWFWWGFFFGFIATIVAFSKPAINTTVSSSVSSSSALGGKYAYTSKDYDNNKLSQGYWKCTCGRMNPDQTGTCGCGRSKYEKQNSIEKKQTITHSEPQIMKKISEDNGSSEVESIELIKKYKELLDIEAITIDEFNKKKREILNLSD